MLRMNFRMWAAALALTLSAAVMDAADWVSLGPASPLTAFAVDPSRPGTLYAATGDSSWISPDSPDYRSTLWKSTDGGLRWTAILTLPSAVPVLVVDPVNPSRLWALRGTSRSSVYRSTDGGQTWTAVFTPQLGNIGSLAVSGEGAVLFAGGWFPAVIEGITVAFTSYPVVYRSADGGISWSREPLEPPRRVEPVWPNPGLPPSPSIEKLAFDSF